MQNEGLVSNSIILILRDSETLAYDFCKAILCDENFLKDNVSLISASSLYIALKLVEKINNKLTVDEMKEVMRLKTIFKNLVQELFGNNIWGAV